MSGPQKNWCIRQNKTILYIPIADTNRHMSYRNVCSCLQASTDMFVLVCSSDASDLRLGGAMALAFSLRQGPWQKVDNCSPFFIVFHSFSQFSPCFTDFHHLSPFVTFVHRCPTVFHHISLFSLLFTVFHSLSPFFIVVHHFKRFVTCFNNFQPFSQVSTVSPFCISN